MEEPGKSDFGREARVPRQKVSIVDNGAQVPQPEGGARSSVSWSRDDDKVQRDRFQSPRKPLEREFSDSSDMDVGGRRRGFSDAYGSIGSDDVFYSPDEFGGGVSPEVGRDSRVPQGSVTGEDGWTSSSSSFGGRDFPRQPGSTSARIKVKYYDPLQGMSLGVGDKSGIKKRVYEEFVKKGQDLVLQKKLINTYDSDDELVERSAFDRLRNRIKRQRREAKRQKERSRGVPSRVITEKDIERFSGKRESDLSAESPGESPQELSPEGRGVVLSSGPEMQTDPAGRDSVRKVEERLAAREAMRERGGGSDIRNDIEKYRSLEMQRSEERQGETEGSEGSLAEYRDRYENVQNPLEVVTYGDELKQLKDARDDYFRTKVLRDLAQEAQEGDRLSSQIEQKEALLRELEAISDELDRKRDRLVSEAGASGNQDAGGGLETREAAVGGDVPPEEASAGGDIPGEASRSADYPEGSLGLDEDAVVMGAERREDNQGIVVLDPESADYQVYFDHSAGQEGEEGLAPVRERYSEEEGLAPVRRSDGQAESEGLAPVGGHSGLEELRAFEDAERSLLPPPEESGVPFEEAYLTRHPELLNTDAVGRGVRKEEAIKRAFGSGDRPGPEAGGTLRRREFESFDLSNEAIERLKR